MQEVKMQPKRRGGGPSGLVAASLAAAVLSGCSSLSSGGPRHSTAKATYTYHWEGSQGDKNFTVKGRGSRVLKFEAGRFRIVHEHLSRCPRPQ